MANGAGSRLTYDLERIGQCHCAYCGGFLDIPPLVTLEDGRTCINPDFDMVQRYHLEAESCQCAAGSIQPGGYTDFFLRLDAEENHMGDMLVNELFILLNPTSARGVRVEVKDPQSNRTFMNEPVAATLFAGDTKLNCCLPCCFFIKSAEQVNVRIYNDEAAVIYASVAARGKRFMPYHRPELREEMIRYWLEVQSVTIPFWVTFDEGFVTVPAGGVAQGQMSIPGGGFFEVKWARCEVRQNGTFNYVDADNILVDVTEGRISRRMMNEPMNLGSFVATPTIPVTGFQGNLYRAASACHCPPYSQFFTGNTRVIHDLENLDGVNDLDVFIAYAGCMHFVSKCPPEEDLRRARGGTFLDAFCCDNPHMLEIPMEDECPEYSGPQECYPEPEEPLPEFPAEVVEQLPPPLPKPEPIKIVDMWRPDGPYFGPGSAPNLPWRIAYGRDQHGKVHVVVRNPNTNEFVRMATAQETPYWAKNLAEEENKKSGMSGLGFVSYKGESSKGPGEWGVI